MRLNIKKIIIFLSVISIFVLQFFLFKSGVISPQIKGVEIEVVEGRHIKDIDKYIIKLGEEVVFSLGDYVKFPSYAKEPRVEFKNLDEKSILEIVDNSNEMEKTFKITANKTGLASVAVVNNDRILKKFNILVVDPKVTKLNLEIDNELKYVGDTASISSVVEVDFNRFNESYKVNYKSSNEDIIKIEDNILQAVGVGKARVEAFIGSKKEVFDYNIVARLKNIVANNRISLEVEESKKIEASVVTSPKNLKTPSLKYTFAENKLPVERKIRLDKNGQIVGLREGTEKIIISCGSRENKVTKTVYVVVKEISIKDKKIQNLDLKYYFNEEDSLILNLKWDLMKGAKKYAIYIRDNNDENPEYRLLEEVGTENIRINDGKIEHVIKLNESNFDDINYDIYVIGINNRQNSLKSEVYNVNNVKNRENDR